MEDKEMNAEIAYANVIFEITLERAIDAAVEEAVREIKPEAYCFARVWNEA
jgi:hypothetical protein